MMRLLLIFLLAFVYVQSEARLKGVLAACAYFGEGPESDRPEIPGTLKDLDLMKNVVGGRPEDIRVVRPEPSKPVTTRRLMDELAKAARDATESDTLIFYFSGHGDRDRTGGVLVLEHETASKNLSGTEERLPQREIISLIKSSKAKTKIVIIDACYSGLLTKEQIQKAQSETNKGATFAEVPSSDPGFYFFASSAADEASRFSDETGHSLFTRALVQTMSEDFDEGQFDPEVLERGVRLRMNDAQRRRQRAEIQTPYMSFPKRDNGSFTITPESNQSLTELANGSRSLSVVDVITRPIVSLNQIPNIRPGIGIVIDSASSLDANRFRALLAAQIIDQPAGAYQSRVVHGSERSAELLALISLTSGLTPSDAEKRKQLVGRYVITGTVTVSVSLITQGGITIYSARVTPTLEMKGMDGQILGTATGMENIGNARSQLVANSSQRDRAIDLALTKAAALVAKVLLEKMKNIESEALGIDEIGLAAVE